MICLRSQNGGMTVDTKIFVWGIWLEPHGEGHMEVSGLGYGHGVVPRGQRRADRAQCGAGGMSPPLSRARVALRWGGPNEGLRACSFGALRPP